MKGLPPSPEEQDSGRIDLHTYVSFQRRRDAPFYMDFRMEPAGLAIM